MQRRLKLLILMAATLIFCLVAAGILRSYFLVNYSVSVENLREQDRQASQLYEAATKQYNRGEYREAIATYKQVLKIRQEIGDVEEEAGALHKIAAAYNRLNDYNKAIEFYQKALEIRVRIADKNGTGNTLNSLGSIYHKQGNYDEALNFYRQALIIRRESGDRLREGRTLSNIGIIFDQLSNYPQALEYYRQAFDIFSTTNRGKEKIAVLANMGTIYNHLGDYNRAIKLYQQALDISREIDNFQMEAGILHNIGLAYHNQKQHRQAEDYYQEALRIRREIEDVLGVATTLNTLGLIYDELGESFIALKLLEEAVEIFQTIGAKWEEGRTFDSIGRVYKSLANYDKAMQFYQRSLTIQKATRDANGERITLSHIGDILAIQNQLELAIFFYKQSVNVTEDIRKNLQVLSREQQQSYSDTVASTYRSLADLLLKQNRVIEAQEILDLLKVQELDNYLQNVRGNSLISSGIDLLPPEREIEEKYQALQQQGIQLEEELLELQQIPEVKRSLQQQQRLYQIERESVQTIVKINEFIASETVAEMVDRMQKIAKAQQLTLPVLTRLDSWLRQHKEQKAVLLYPLVLADRIELVLLTPDTPPIRRTVPVKREEFNQAIAKFRSALTNRSRAELLSRFKNVKKTGDLQVIEPASQLYNWLIKPIENDLKTADAETIIYAPDGQLRYIPLAALYDGNHWLIERFRINIITAATLMDFDSNLTTQPRILAGGLTEGSFNFQVGKKQFDFQALEFAAPEVESLTTLFPNTTKLLGKAFTMSGMVSQMNEHQIVHLATHAAFVKGEPEDSFILFGDGNLVTLRDVGNWNLKNVDLVVLSACQTGVGGILGNGEEILGFGYMMQQAGALAALATLWRVDDAATQNLMEAFYSELQGDNITKIEALRQAQLSLIASKYKGGHPYYWAPFILIGNGL